MAATIDLLTQHLWAPIQSLLADPEVNDIFIDRFDRIYKSHAGQYYATDFRWESESALRAAVDMLSNEVNGTPLGANRYVLDTRFTDGSRVTVNVPPLTKNTVLTIRVARAHPYRLDQLKGRMFPAELAPWLHQLARTRVASILVTGATNSAKTTLMRALMLETALNDRMFVIEDTRELRVPIERGVEHEIPAGNSAGYSMTDSIKAALRAAPDRLAVGEIRIPEAVQAFLEGFEAGIPWVITSIHARNALVALQRVESLLSRTRLFDRAESYRSLIYNNVTHVLHCRRCADGVRRLVEVGVVRDGRLILLWKWDDESRDWLYDADEFERYGGFDDGLPIGA